jgi:hypothetical protein
LARRKGFPVEDVERTGSWKKARMQAAANDSHDPTSRAVAAGQRLDDRR